MPENWDAVQIFLRCSCQWRYRGDGQREALDVQAVISVISLYQLPPAEQLVRLDQVQLIELGAINFMNQPRN